MSSISLILRLVSVLDRTPSCKSFLMLWEFVSSWSFLTCFFDLFHVLFVIVHVFLCSAVDAKITPGRLYDPHSRMLLGFPVQLELEAISYSSFLLFRSPDATGFPEQLPLSERCGRGCCPFCCCWEIHVSLRVTFGPGLSESFGM